MITKYNEAYLVLFDKATARLAALNIKTALTRDLPAEEDHIFYGSKLGEDGKPILGEDGKPIITTDISEISGNDTIAKIGSIEEYFANLDYLVNGTEENPNTSEDNYIFLKLPLDEPAFKINANERKIYIPDNFKKYGLSVVGDEVAEIIFFEIDRFYDATDLSIMDITIEWERNGEKHNTPAFIRDIESKASEDKLIFGWPITSEITSVAGPLKFAVRFYETDANKNLLYSWSTTPEQIAISNSINGEIQNQVANDATSLILDRLSNSPMGGVGDASLPVFLAEIYNIDGLNLIKPYGISNGTKNGHIIDSVEEGKDIILAVLAIKDDSGKLTYRWTYNKDMSDTTDGAAAPQDDAKGRKYTGWVNPNTHGEYLATKNFIEDTSFVPSKKIVTYYHKEDDTYKVVYATNKQEFDAEKAKLGVDVLYILCCAYVLSYENVQAGYYSVDAMNKYYNTTAVYSKENEEKAPHWIVARAEVPQITSYLPEEKALKLNESLGVGVTSVDTSTVYAWYKQNNEFIVEVDGKYEPIEKPFNEIAIPDTNNQQYKPVEEGYYAIKIVNSKNRTEEIAWSNSCLILDEIADVSNDDLSVTVTDTDVIVEFIQRKPTTYETVTYEWSKVGEEPFAITTEGIYDAASLEPGLYFCKVIISKGNNNVVESKSALESFEITE